MSAPRLVRCSKCGYAYSRDHMQVVDLYPGGREVFRCSNRRLCAGRVAERDRLDAWKQGQR